MNIAIGVSVVILVILVLLGLWEHRIRELRQEEALADLHEARERGTDRPLAQYPQIDVQACIGCGSCVAACPEEGVLGLVEGVAHVIHGVRCIGHGLCEQVCPIGAIKVGLGDAPVRADIPVLTERLETSVPGIFIAGELGGLALIRVATAQAVRAVDAIAADLRRAPAQDPDPEAFDLLIVGAGPAGIAASLRAEELHLHYAAIDQEDVGGTVRKYPRRKLTLTGEMSLPLHGRFRQREFLKEELIALWESIIDRHQLNIHAPVRLRELRGTADAFVADTTRGMVAARRVLLALGRRGTPRKLGVPGEETEKVLYQLIDAATYTGEHVLVVGGGDSAVEAATALAEQRNNTVTLSYRRDAFFRLKARNQQRIEAYQDGRVRVLFGSQVRSIAEDSVVLDITRGGKASQETLRNDYVFILAGGDPPYRLLKDLGIRFGGAAGNARTVPADDPALAR